MLAGENDLETVNLQGDGRAINRHNYSVEEIKKDSQKPVVKRLVKLIKFRNEYDAFNGEFKVENSDEKQIKLKWQKENKKCRLSIDLNNYKTVISYLDDHRKEIQEII